MLVWVLISWCKCQPPDQYYCKFWFYEKGEFWPQDQKFDLLKKLNFDLMKFNLMISFTNFEAGFDWKKIVSVSVSKMLRPFLTPKNNNEMFKNINYIIVQQLLRPFLSERNKENVLKS